MQVQRLILRNWDVKEEAADRNPYKEWLLENRIHLNNQPWERKTYLGKVDVLQQQTAFGFTAEDLDLIIEAMASEVITSVIKYD